LGGQTFAPPNAGVRQSFAQLLPPSQISAGENDSKKEARKLQPKRKVMTVRRKRQPVVAVQRQYSGFFDTRW
jgi:hypothetical protein